MDRQMVAIVTGGIAGIVILPACAISPVLVLGCAAVMAVSIPFMERN